MLIKKNIVLLLINLFFQHYNSYFNIIDFLEILCILFYVSIVRRGFTRLPKGFRTKKAQEPLFKINSEELGTRSRKWLWGCTWEQVPLSHDARGDWWPEYEIRDALFFVCSSWWHPVLPASCLSGSLPALCWWWSPGARMLANDSEPGLVLF